MNLLRHNICWFYGRKFIPNVIQDVANKSVIWMNKNIIIQENSDLT